MENNIAYGIFDYRKIFTKLADEDPNFLKKEIFSIKGDSLKTLLELYDQLEISIKSDDNNDNKKLTNNNGKILEKIAKFIFLQNHMYQVKNNIRDSSNEIDLILKLNDLGNQEISILPDVLKNNKEFIIECKNYKRKIGVTWVGKFFSLLINRNLKFGIIISYHPLAGKGEWDSAKGLVKKLFLKSDIAIINICKDDIKRIKDGETNIIELIEAKYNNLIFQTDLDKCISKHPAEQ